MLTVDVTFPLGLAGKVEKGPSCMERLLGGLPLVFPDALVAVLRHALDTAGPFRLRDGPGDLLVVEGCADLGSSKDGLAIKPCLGVMAD